MLIRFVTHEFTVSCELPSVTHKLRTVSCDT